MRYLIAGVGLLMVGACATASGPQKTSDFCTVFDAKTGFTRCETTEVICYGTSCWAKPKAPLPAPTLSPGPVVTKIK